MENTSTPTQATLELLRGWLAARSIARDLPQPVSEHGGLRVETGLPNEIRRFVFAEPHSAISELAQTIFAPNIFIKLCGTGEQLLALVPPRWWLQDPSYLMTYDGPCGARRALGAAYRLEMTNERNVTSVRILDNDGALAASGYAAEYGGAFVYDRIVTEEAHRRQGLGRAVMAALGSARRSSASQQVLVATEDGRALYSSLGWTVHTPYATVVIPAHRD